MRAVRLMVAPDAMAFTKAEGSLLIAGTMPMAMLADVVEAPDQLYGVECPFTVTVVMPES